MKVRTRTGEYTDSRPGWRPSREFIQAIQRLHPRIHLLWGVEEREWCLVERGMDGKWHRFRLVGTYPRVWQCLRVLRRAKMIRLDPKRFLERMDATLETSDTEAQDRLREGSERLWSIHGTSEVVGWNGPGSHSA